MRGNDSIALLKSAQEWSAQGRKLAMATVVSTWGSSPRQVGSQLLVADGGAFLGSVSGGCVESAVVQKAQEVIESGNMELVEYGVSNDEAWSVGLTCGGQIRIMIERIA